MKISRLLSTLAAARIAHSTTRGYMGLPAFDTHAYVKRLRSVGFNEDQAEAQAELQPQVLSSLVTEKLATKADVSDLKNDIALAQSELKSEVARLGSEMKQDSIHTDEKFNTLNWMIGSLLAGMVAIL